jgi:hypothetical protein
MRDKLIMQLPKKEEERGITYNNSTKSTQKKKKGTEPISSI